MMNEVIKKMLQDGYNSVAFTDKYILGWTLDHVVYMAICDRELVDRVTCLDLASRGLDMLFALSRTNLKSSCSW